MRQTHLWSALLLLPLLIVGSVWWLRASPAAPTREPSQSRDLLIRFEVKGGLLRPESTHVPEWSLYGDGEVIWTDEGQPTAGFTRHVWIGHLRDDEILQLMTFAEQVGFWKLENYYQPSPQISSDQKTVTLDPNAMPDQPSSTLTVRWKARQKQVTVYPADWQGAPEAYRGLRDLLLQTRPPGGHQFQPQNFQVTVRTVASDKRTVEIPWPFPNIDLAKAQSGSLRLTRDEGLAVAELFKNGPPIVLYSGQSFSLQLYADPPREP